MLKYLVKRIIYFLPTLVVVAFMVFVLIHLIPGDPAVAILGSEASPEAVASLREALGLNKPLPIQFIAWLGDAARGNFGISLQTKLPVFQSILERFPVTLTLTTFSLVFSLMISLPAGILAALYRNTKKDYFFMLLTTLGVSCPGFWLGLVALVIFSLKLGWFPSSGFVPVWENVWQGLRYMLLPSLTMGAAMAAVVARMTRSSMLEVLNLEYISHARAKGLTEWKIILKHALKNAFAPTLTTIGIQYGVLLGGAVVTETVFALPGIGRFIVTAISQRDYPVVQGCILYMALVYLVMNLFVDILYVYFDPRIEY